MIVCLSVCHLFPSHHVPRPSSSSCVCSSIRGRTSPYPCVCGGVLSLFAVVLFGVSICLYWLYFVGRFLRFYFILIINFFTFSLLSISLHKSKIFFPSYLFYFATLLFHLSFFIIITINTNPYVQLHIFSFNSSIHIHTYPFFLSILHFHSVHIHIFTSILHHTVVPLRDSNHTLI